jgi:hypothetical protein
MEWIIFWFIINCIVGYLIGRQKNDVASAIALSLILGPIGWLISALSRGDLRKCPHCAEFVKPEAMTCRYCGKDLPRVQATPVDRPIPEPLRDVELSRSEKIWMVVFLAMLVVVGVISTLYFKYTDARDRQRGDAVVHEENVIRDGRTTATQAVAPTEALQPVSYPKLTLTQPVDLKDSLGHVMASLQAGQSLPYRYRDGYQALVLYEGHDYQVRISSTNIK